MSHDGGVMVVRKVGLAVLAGLGLLGAPWLCLTAVPPVLGGYGFVAGAYLLAAVLAWGLRSVILEWPAGARAVATATTTLAVAGAVGAGVVAGAVYLMLVCLAASCLVFFLALVEKRLNLIYSGSALVYVALTQLVSVMGYASWLYGLVLVAPAILVFSLGYSLENERGDVGLVLRICGLAGTFAGVLVTLVAGGAGQTPMFCLLVGAMLLLLEGYIENSLFMVIAAGGLVIAAYNWLLVFAQIYEAQLYALPWTVYFAILARRDWKSASTRLVFLSLALAGLTLPIMAEAAGDNGAFYGIEVIVLGLALAMIGSVAVNPLVTWWGGGVALIEILYLVPKYIWPGTDIPLICSASGLAVLAITVMVRTSRGGESEG